MLFCHAKDVALWLIFTLRRFLPVCLEPDYGLLQLRKACSLVVL